MEYFCHLCREWYDTAYCQSHFDSVHGQKDVSFERLKNRLQWVGGIETRDENDVVEENEGRVFVTNNFTHHL